MRFDPALRGGSLVGCVVVNDEMEIESGGGLLIDQFEKAQELAMTMARHARRVSERMCKQVSMSLPCRGDSHDDHFDDYRGTSGSTAC